MALLYVGRASYGGVMGTVEGHGGGGNGGSVDRASISAELAVLEGFMRQTEKHREQDIVAVDPDSPSVMPSTWCTTWRSARAT